MALAPLACCLALAGLVGLGGCGGSVLHRRSAAVQTSQPKSTQSTMPASSGSAIASDAAGRQAGRTGQGPAALPFQALATKNTTRVPNANPLVAAADIALATFPSAAPGTHPSAVVLASTREWQAALAASVLMAAPIHAPILFADGPHTLPAVTADALKQLAPTGAGAIDGAQVIAVGQVPKPAGYRVASISGVSPAALAAAIDRFASAARGRPTPDVVVASASHPAYAMPAAGWAAESGDPILFVDSSGVPAATAQGLLGHSRPHIYVLGPANVIPASVAAQLARYGTVKRIGASVRDPAANSVTFAEYRDPPCVYEQPCAHLPGSFGWAIRSPGHGYTLINASDTLDAAAAAPLSGSADFGPELLIEKSTTLPSSVMSYLLNYATPGYTGEGPTAAVYNHAWLIGSPAQISLEVQAQVDQVLQAVPQR